MTTHPLTDVLQHLRRAVLPVREEMTDGQLLGAFLEQRDDAALAALIRRHGPLVWGVCRRVLRHGQEQEAEDAFQATFLLLVRRAVTIRERDKVAHWLYRVAHQTALRARANVARRNLRERQVQEMPEPLLPERDLWSDLQPLLDQELNRLPESYGVVLVLCDLEGKTRQEAARHLGCPEGTIASRLARARAMLAKRLARHGLVVAAGTLATLLPQNAASAGVPPAALSTALRAASLLATGQAVVPGAISFQVLALTEGVQHAMRLAKLKLLLTVLLAAFGIGLMMHLALAQQPAGVAGDKPEKANPAVERQLDSSIRKWKEQTTLQGHSGEVTSVAFSPDGNTLASGSWDHTAKLWDVATGKERASLKEHSCGVGTVAFSPDGKTLAAAINGSPGVQRFMVKLWDVETGKERAALKGESTCGGIGTVAFSPDGKLLASATHNGTIKLWDVATGNERAILPVDAHFVMCVAFSPDSKTLALASKDNSVKLWDVATGKERAILQGHTSSVRSVAFSSDGRTLASASHDQTVKLWEVATGKERATFEGHASGVLSVAFSPDGKTLATASDDKTVKLWDVATGKERTTFQGHTSDVRSVAFSPDGKTLASASGDGTVKLWDISVASKAQLPD